MEISLFILVISYLIFLLYKELLKEGLISKFKCGLGFHTWGNWPYKKSNSCLVKETCNYCNFTRGKAEYRHTWLYDYVEAGSCKKQTVCRRCHETRGPVAIEHENWSNIYVDNYSCKKQTVCLRCREISGPETIEHSWIDEYLGPYSNKIQPRCTRCDKKGRIRVTQTNWIWIFENGIKRARFLELQNVLSTLLNSKDSIYLSDLSNLKHQIEIDTTKTVLPGTNAQIFGFVIGNYEICFFPEGLKVTVDSTYQIVHYENLNFEVSTIDLIERSNQIETEAEIVGKSWLYRRVDGGPDRRFVNNYEIPIRRYGLIRIKFPNQILNFAFSNSTVMDRFTNSFNDYSVALFGKRIVTKTINRNRNYYNDSDESYEANKTINWKKRLEKERQKWEREEKERLERLNSQEAHAYANNNYSYEPPLTIDRAYEIIGIGSNSTKEQVEKAYRKLAQQNHPDKVSSLAIEFRELAEKKMKLLNEAHRLILENLNH